MKDEDGRDIGSAAMSSQPKAERTGDDPGPAASSTQPGRPVGGSTPIRFRRVRHHLSRFSMAGSAMALVFYCLSLTPSLLPRAWFLQAVISGIATALGYGFGVLVGWLARSLLPWRPSAELRRRTWWGLAVVAVALLVLFTVLGARWQHQIRDLVGASEPSEAWYFPVATLALLIAAGLVGLARALRRTVRRLAGLLGRFIPARAATAIGIIVVGALAVLIVDGVLYHVVISTANRAFEGVDQQTTPGTVPPTSAARSGSPASLISWTTLGRQGRDFVAGGPSSTQISAFTGHPALEPIRVYSGLESASSPRDAAALVVKELDRTGAFSRQALVVATTTGTGWLNPDIVDPLEYMYGGDTAEAGMQYSYLPSWVSFLVDKDNARTAGQELFDQVHARWSQLPPDHRPMLVVFGESLGSFGGEGAFSGTEDITNRTNGVVWVGPPNSNELWRRFVANRDPRTPEWLPTYQAGQTVRFAADPSDLNRPSTSWTTPRVVYLQHASDPITWWSPRLVLHKPDWLREPPGRDVLPSMRWYPLVTFWQVSADMVFAVDVPPGHGHTYGPGEAIASWQAVVPPPGWTADRTAQLTHLLVN